MPQIDEESTENQDVQPSSDNHSKDAPNDRKVATGRKQEGSIVERITARYSHKHLTIGAKGLHGAGDCYRSQRRGFYRKIHNCLPI